MYSGNETGAWLESKTDEEQSSIIKTARRSAGMVLFLLKSVTAK